MVTFHRDSCRHCLEAQKRHSSEQLYLPHPQAPTPHSFQVWRKALILLHIHRTVLNSSKMKLGTCASTTWGTQEGTIRHLHYPFVVHSSINKHIWSMPQAHTLLIWATLASGCAPGCVPGCAQSKEGTAQPGLWGGARSTGLRRTGGMLLPSLLCLPTAPGWSGSWTGTS